MARSRRPVRSGGSSGATGPARSCSRRRSTPTTAWCASPTACPPRGDALDLVRRVEGVSRPGADAHAPHGPVRLRLDRAVGAPPARGARRWSPGPTALLLRTPVELHGEDFSTVAEFTVAAGRPRALRARSGTRRTCRRRRRSRSTTPSTVTERWWSEWSGRRPDGGALGRRGAGLARRPQGPHLRPDRRHRGRRHHVAARGHRRTAGTGTTATAGCGTPPSRCSRSWPAATPTRPRRGGTGCCAPWPAGPTRPRSCTAPAGSTG